MVARQPHPPRARALLRRLALTVCPNPVVYANALFELEQQRSRQLQPGHGARRPSIPRDPAHAHRPHPRRTQDRIPAVVSVPSRSSPPRRDSLFCFFRYRIAGQPQPKAAIRARLPRNAAVDDSRTCCRTVVRACQRRRQWLSMLPSALQSTAGHARSRQQPNRSRDKAAPVRATAKATTSTA